MGERRAKAEQRLGEEASFEMRVEDIVDR